MKTIHDRNGKPSSKRLAGFLLLLIGTALRVFVVIMAYIQPNITQTSGAIALQASDPFFLFGAALLGLGVIEGVKIGGDNGKI